jgi:ABC-type transport system involved in multi-copper enzyme maturation permease subunit
MASGVASVVTWFQRSVPWSNTGRAWLERVAFVGVIAATAALIVYGGRLPVWSYVLAWGALLVLFGFLLRQGWIFLFGPVLFYDLVRNARRTRNYIIRLLIVGLLFFILCMLYWSWFVGPDIPRYDAANTTHVSEFTMTFFKVFVSIQFALVILLTPAYVSGAICEEKERKTIEYILATDLRNREIVLGKFVSRLLHLTMLLIAALPILSAVQFMGGIDPELLLACYAATGLTMLSIAGVSLFASTICRRTRDAILIVYLAILIYFAIWGFSEYLNFNLGSSSFPSTRRWSSPVTLGELCQGFVFLFRVGNPIAALIEVGKASAITGALVWSLLQPFAVFHLGLAAVSVLGSMALLRRAALTPPKPPSKRRTWFGLGRKRRLPRVGNYPMIWKEVFVERAMRVHILLPISFTILVILSFFPPIAIFIHFIDQFGAGYGPRSSWDPWKALGEDMNIWVRIVGMLVGVLGLIGVAVRAATSVRGEHDRDTLDALLTSPMGSEEILAGKWLGSILSVRWVMVWLLCIWGLGVLTGGMSVTMLPLIIIAWLIFAGASASLGLWYSVTSKSSLKALLATLFVGLLITLGHWLPTICCGVCGVFGRTGPNDAAETLMQIQLGLTPQAVLAMLPFRTDDFLEHNRNHDFPPIKMVIFSMGGVFCWAIFAWGIWQATNERFKRLTSRTGKSARDRYPRAVVLSTWPEN